MPQLVIAVFGTAMALGAMAILALAWAIRTGQFDDFRSGATSIFDEEEPIGEMTDSFPDRGDGSSREGAPWRRG
jgi:cbb3-type cytochrome oxidase maturation protein